MQLQGLDNVFAQIYRLEDRLADSKTPLAASGQVMQASIVSNVMTGGRPTFTPLAASTIAARARRGTGSTPLFEYGNMVGGLETIVTDDSAEAGSNAVQANRMQYGWPNHTPARPWVMYQPEDIDAVGEIFMRHYSL